MRFFLFIISTLLFDLRKLEYKGLFFLFKAGLWSSGCFNIQYSLKCIRCSKIAFAIARSKSVGWGGGKGGGAERRGLGPRNDFITTCKAVTLCGGQRILAIFFLSKARGEPAEKLTQ